MPKIKRSLKNIEYHINEMDTYMKAAIMSNESKKYVINKVLENVLSSNG